VDRGEYSGTDANARRRNARRRRNREGIWMDREKVRIESIVVRGAERQPVAPVVRTVVCFPADVRGLHQTRMSDRADSALTSVLG
jgi:hypothetical protein